MLLFICSLRQLQIGKKIILSRLLN